MKYLLDEDVRVFDHEGGQSYRARIVEGQAPELTLVQNRDCEKWLVPGFVDNHIHGAFGIDFMDADRDAMVWLADMLVAEGYEGFLPTTITADFADIRRAIDSLPDHPAIWGFHLEGPFISPEYPGAQPPEHILDPPTGPSEWDWVFDHPKLKVITMAPELPGAPAGH